MWFNIFFLWFVLATGDVPGGNPGSTPGSNTPITDVPGSDGGGQVSGSDNSNGN